MHFPHSQKPRWTDVGLTRCLILTLPLLLNCQGGGDGPKPATAVTPLAVGNHILAFSIEPPSTLSHPISGLSITYLVPPGMELATETGAETDASTLRPLDAQSLKAGSAMPLTPHLGGTYRADLRQLELFAAAPCTTPWQGEFLTLTFTIKPGSLLTQDDLLQVLNRPIQQKCVAFDASVRSSVQLDSQLSVKATLIQ